MDQDQRRPADPTPAPIPVSAWEANERRASPRWLAPALAIPSAILLCADPILTIAAGASAYDQGRAFAAPFVAIVAGLILRTIYVVATRRPRRAILSLWVLPLAAIALVATNAMSYGRELAGERAAIEGIETPDPAAYLRIDEPFTLAAIPPDEEEQVRVRIADDLAEANATGLEIRYIEFEAEPVGILMVMGVRPEDVADPASLERVMNGMGQAGASPTLGDLAGRPIIRARDPAGNILLAWHHESLLVTVTAADEESAEELALALMEANP